MGGRDHGAGPQRRLRVDHSASGGARRRRRTGARIRRGGGSRERGRTRRRKGVSESWGVASREGSRAGHMPCTALQAATAATRERATAHGDPAAREQARRRGARLERQPSKEAKSWQQHHRSGTVSSRRASCSSRPSGRSPRRARNTRKRGSSTNERAPRSESPRTTHRETITRSAQRDLRRREPQRVGAAGEQRGLHGDDPAAFRRLLNGGSCNSRIPPTRCQVSFPHPVP